ncbi:MAG: Hpt domain-containing protein [Methyloligellaceae bacterium]
MEPETETENETDSADDKAYVIASSDALAKRCVRPGNGLEAAQKAIKAAEHAIEELSVNFKDWMVGEVERLARAGDAIKADGPSESTVEDVFAVAHDIKGQAGTFGYPLAGDICASLCRLLDTCPDKSRIPVVLVEQHVDAVKAILREDAKGDDNRTACELSGQLRDVTEHFLAQLMTRAHQSDDAIAAAS